MRAHFVTLTSMLTFGVALTPAAEAKHRIIPIQKSEDSGTMRRADSKMRKVLMKLNALGPKALGSVDPDESRKQPTPADAVAGVLKDEGEDPEKMKADSGITIQDVTYPGGDGSQIAARIYKPAAPASNLPVVLYIHGGGWVIADIETYDSSPRALVKKTGAIFVSVHYRQAPENKFPASHEDTVAAYKWVLANAQSWGGDVKKVAVVGESVGGNMAINVAVAAREQNLQMPLGVVSVYPVAGVSTDTPSYRRNENAKPLNKAGMAWFIKNETNGASDLSDPRLDMVNKGNFKGLPPTTIITDEIDPLMSEGQMLAQKMQSQGVKVNSRNYTGVTHEFFGMGAVIKKADDAENFAAAALKAAFGDKAAAK